MNTPQDQGRTSRSSSAPQRNTASQRSQVPPSARASAAPRTSAHAASAGTARSAAANNEYPKKNVPPTRSAPSRQKPRTPWLVPVFCLILAVLILMIAIISHKQNTGDPKETDPVNDTNPTDSSADTGNTHESVDSSDNGTATEPSSGDVTDPADPPEELYPAADYGDLTFKTNLLVYERYMEPEDRDAYLILVNPSHPLDSNDTPSDLINVEDTRKDGRATQLMRLTAEKALEAFLKEARANGFTDVTVTSGYRSYASQASVFATYVQREMTNHPEWTTAQAEAKVITYSCRAGTSEHQSGLCIDMHNLAAADVSFAKQPAAAWLEENCWKFGFILRFPADKTEITAISYEPWHFRFVGRYHAWRMHELDMCLEEYIDYLGLDTDA